MSIARGCYVVKVELTEARFISSVENGGSKAALNAQKSYYAFRQLGVEQNRAPSRVESCL